MSTFLGLRTIDELINYTYGRTPDEIYKTAGGFSTGDAGAYNPLYGALVYANFNLEANVWAALPKYVWDFSGWRIFTGKGNSLADAGSSNNTSKGGTVQGGLIAAAVKPDPEEVTVLPKTLQYVFQASEVLEYLVENSRDDAWGSLAQQRVYASDQTKELWNQMLTTKVSGFDTSADNLSRLDLESLDRVIASKAEYDALGGGVTAKYNPWKDTASITRNSATKYDSYVTSPTASFSTSDVLTDALLRDTLANIRIAGGKEPTFMVGGQDTYSEVQSIYMNAYRIQNTADLRSEFNVSVNGIQTFTGTGVGLHISTVYGLPFIPTKDAPKESGDVGDLYILNTSAEKNSPMKPMLGLQILKPIVYYEASKRIQGWPFTVGSFNDKGMYESLAELTCTNFKGQGKIVRIKKGI